MLVHAFTCFHMPLHAFTILASKFDSRHNGVHVFAYAPKTVLVKCRFLTFLIWGGLGGVGGVITFLASVSR